MARGRLRYGIEAPGPHGHLDDHDMLASLPEPSDAGGGETSVLKSRPMSPKLIIDGWNEKQKEQYLERHFEHEIGMLHSCTDSVCQYEQTRSPNGILMALEACLFHARNLEELFFKPRSKTNYSNTVLACCFVQDKTKWEEVRGPVDKWPWMKQVHDRASLELAHLTTDRTGGPHTWDCPAILKEASILTLLLLDNLPLGHGSNRILQDVKRRCRAIRSSSQQGGVVTTSQRWVNLPQTEWQTME